MNENNLHQKKLDTNQTSGVGLVAQHRIWQTTPASLLHELSSQRPSSALIWI